MEEEEEWVENVYKAKVDSLPSASPSLTRAELPPILLLQTSVHSSGPYSDGCVPGSCPNGRTVRRYF